MSMEQSFNDLGVDAIKGSEIMELLQFSPEELSFPQRFNQLKEVISFMQNFDDYRFVINKITRGKQVDKLDHVWNYINIQKEREQKQVEAQNLQKKVDTLSPDSMEYFTANDKKQELLKDVEILTKEMESFEK